MGWPGTPGVPGLADEVPRCRRESATISTVALLAVVSALAVVGNGAAVGVANGGYHAAVEPVGVGSGAGDREHPEGGVGIGHVARAGEALRRCRSRSRRGNAGTCAACCEC